MQEMKKEKPITSNNTVWFIMQLRGQGKCFFFDFLLACVHIRNRLIADDDTYTRRTQHKLFNVSECAEREREQTKAETTMQQ